MKVFVPWPVHPVHEIVSAPADCVVTVRVVVPLTPLWLALIVVVPVLTAVARPVLLMVATPGEEELQVAEEEISLLELLPKVPVAVNCCVFVNWIEGLVGEMAIATSVSEDGKNFPQLALKDTNRSSAMSQ